MGIFVDQNALDGNARAICSVFVVVVVVWSRVRFRKMHILCSLINIWQHYTVERSHSWRVCVCVSVCKIWLFVAGACSMQRDHVMVVFLGEHNTKRAKSKPSIAHTVQYRNMCADPCVYVFRCVSCEHRDISYYSIKHKTCTRVCMCESAHFLGLELSQRPRIARQMHARSHVISTSS